MKHNTKAFSIIEVMIAIFVFAFGLTSVFAMLSGSINMSDYSRNLIVASHLADEQLELFKNIRDSNYKKSQQWNIQNPAEGFGSETFDIDTYYKLDYNTSTNSNSFPTTVEELTNFQGPNGNAQPTSSEITYMNDNYRLCMTSDGRYTYDCSPTSGNTETNYYRYIHIETPDYIGDDAFKVTAVVLWTGKKFHSTEISTIVTDWKRY